MVFNLNYGNKPALLKQAHLNEGPILETVVIKIESAATRYQSQLCSKEKGVCKIVIDWRTFDRPGAIATLYRTGLSLHGEFKVT